MPEPARFSLPQATLPTPKSRKKKIRKEDGLQKDGPSVKRLESHWKDLMPVRSLHPKLHKSTKIVLLFKQYGTAEMRYLGQRQHKHVQGCPVEGLKQ